MANGFPRGLRPDHWMGDFVQKKLGPERQKNIRITDFHYPGSHDAATYGHGIAEFSYECQDKSLYEQMMVGQRAFDIRLGVVDGGKKFRPVHGIAKGTADDFNNTPDSADDKDLAGQIMRFAREHPTEMLILKFSMDGMDTDQEKRAWAQTAWNLLGKRMIKARKHDEPQVKYHEAVENNKNIIFAMYTRDIPKENPLHEHCFDISRGTAPHWQGEGNPELWNEPDWQSGDLDRVIRSTEGFIDKHREDLIKRNKFWTANTQLTPALGAGFSDFLKDGGSIRPKDLALGGGIDLFGKGHFDGSNKHLRECGVLKKPLWKKHASILLYDFADTHTAGAIVAMNLEDGDPDDVRPERAGPEGHQGGGGGGHGLGPGGPGRGDHQGQGGGRGGGDIKDVIQDKAQGFMEGLAKKF